MDVHSGYPARVQQPHVPRQLAALSAFTLESHVHWAPWFVRELQPPPMTWPVSSQPLLVKRVHTLGVSVTSM